MTHNQSELRAEILDEFNTVLRLAPSDYTENCTNIVMSIVDNYITANYTPNSEVAERERAAIEEYKRYALPAFLLFLNGTKDWEMYKTKILLDMFNDELTKPKEQTNDQL